MKINKDQIINGVVVGIVAGITMFVLSGIIMLGSRAMHSQDSDRDWGNYRMMDKKRMMNYDSSDYPEMMDTREAGDTTPMDPEEAIAQ